MIRNDRQYRVTKTAILKFEDALRVASSDKYDQLSDDARIRQAEREAMAEQLADLRAQVREYDDLATGKVNVLASDSIADFPLALVRARISQGLSQRDLAQRLGLKEQQVQRYEATDYRQASLARLLEVATALNVQVREDVLLPNSKRTVKSVLARLRDLGISKALMRRLLPKDALQVEGARDNAADRLLFEAARSISRVFGWTYSSIVGGERPLLDRAILGGARFKLREGAEAKALEAYTFYAHYLALLVANCSESLPKVRVPTNPHEIRSAIMNKYGQLSLDSAIRYCWDLGVAVLPLADPGSFHGACWRVDGRNVLVLKQRTQSNARWLVDLLHEFRHAGEDPESETLTVVEVEELSKVYASSPDERAATDFACDVALSGRAEELVQECVRIAGNRIENLKAVVPSVARAASLDPAVLANYLAFRLSLQGENWWGAATNLQPPGENPWRVARDILLERGDFSRLTPQDRDLLARALQEEDDDGRT
jgi:transcriptional regulator with XRE-family HTH domain